MKNILISTGFAILLLIGDTVANADESWVNPFQSPEEIVTAYFNYLKTGDVRGIQSIIGENLFDRCGQMFKDVEKYSKFLKEHYGAAELDEIELSYIDKTAVTCIMNIRIGDEVVEYNLRLNMVDGVWKITEDYT